MLPTLSLKPSADLHNTLVDIHDAVDRIVAMRAQETTYAAPDYLRGQLFSEDNSSDMCIDEDFTMEVDAQCRVKMCEWCYQVVDYFKFQRETVQISMSYLDRFLANREGLVYLADRAMYQLAAITCLYVAIKVHEPMELDMSLLVELSRGSYGIAEIMDMEDSILNSLQWKMNPPTAMAIAQHMLSVLPVTVSMDARQALMDVARYQTELCLFDYMASVLMKPSAVATAAVLNALEGVASISPTTKSQFIRNLGKMTGCTRHMEGVSECRKLMLVYLQGHPLAGESSDCARGDEAQQGTLRQKSSSRINMTESSPVAIAETHL